MTLPSMKFVGYSSARYGGYQGACVAVERSSMRMPVCLIPRYYDNSKVEVGVGNRVNRYSSGVWSFSES